jgi:glycosyltransferase involved in cell wall biosynthesis
VSDASLRQLRVLHVVSSGGVPASLQQTLFMPLLTRMPKHRVKAQVACLSPNAVPAAVLRQNGVPVHDVALSRHRFSFGGLGELVRAAKQFRPDIIQAWGHTAQIVSVTLRKRCDWKPKLVWGVAPTAPLLKDAGLMDRQKLKYAARRAAKADRIVYSSEAAAAQHRRVGYPDGGHLSVPPGVDATRFKPDFAARRKVREQLNLPAEAFVIGMVAPFQPESDYPTLLKAAGELIKSNPNVHLALAGHGVQKGNAPLMALVGGGNLGSRSHLLGEWSDVASLFSACDIVCSSSLNDASRMTLVMAMLCGIPCVATGMGAQGEVVGQFGVAIEPGSPAAFIKGINRVMQLPPEKRAFMAQGARKHALENFVYVRSLQKYLQLYYDLIGRQALVAQDVPTPEIDATVPVPPPMPKTPATKPDRDKATVADLSDPDSLEAKVQEQEVALPKWRVDQEEARAKRESELAQQVSSSQTAGDVLEVFAEKISSTSTSAAHMNERARGVADESEELLPQEMLEAPAPNKKGEAPKVVAAAAVEPKAAPAAPKPVAVEAKAAAKPVAADSKPAAIEPKPAVIEPKPELIEPTPAMVEPKLALADDPVASAPAPTPLAIAAVEIDEPQTLSLFATSAPAPAPQPAVESPDEGTFQLELLPDPPVEHKRAVGDA